MDGDGFCRILEKAIKDDIGYEVVLAVKDHLPFLQQVAKICPSPSVTVSQPEHLLLRCGNCIPAALAAVLGHDDVVKKLVDAGEGESYQVPGSVRSYREVAALVGCTLAPAWQTTELTEGNWLLHTTFGSKPHCICVVVGNDDTVHIHHAGSSYMTTGSGFTRMLASSVDRNTMIFFKVNDAEGCLDGLDPLLDLQARTAVSIFDCDIDDFNQDIPDIDQVDQEEGDEANVNVEKALVGNLNSEVKGMVAAIKSKVGWAQFKGDQDAIVCPFCPFRKFRGLKKQGGGKFRKHILEHHAGKDVATTVGKEFVASGSKQWNVIRALHDQLLQAQVEPSGLLRQSAYLIRIWLEDCCLVGMDAENLVDRKLVLCLTGGGPKYLSAEMVKTSNLYRTIGYVWYDREFAMIFFGEMIRSNGKAKTVATNLMHFFLARGCPVVFLLPRKATTVYLKIMEDILSSPVVVAWKDRLLTQCLEHHEFVNLSMDATVRMAMRLKGKANYKQPKEVKDSYLVGDSEAKRRILTLRGRTGAVLSMHAIKSEASDVIKDFLLDTVPLDIRAQVQFVASDQPSVALLQQLRIALPSLQAIHLDEVHLAIVWNIAFWRKSTPSQQALRRVQAKFNRVDISTPVEQWGNFYTGVQPVNYTPAEEQMRELIMSGGMSAHRAATVLNNLEDEKPWYCRLDYLRALAALAAAFPQEMSRKTYVQGRKLAHVLWCAAARDKASWLWNSMIVRRSLPRSWLTLLPAGTASNESLHAELNRWWRNSPEQFPTTLQLHLAVGHLGKLLAHNAALYSPTSRQVSHDQVLALAVQGVQFTEQAWRSWCEAGIVAEMPLFKDRENLSSRLAAQPKPAPKQKSLYKVMKKPAGVRKKTAAKFSKNVVVVKAGARFQVKKFRRTPFRLKRLGSK